MAVSCTLATFYGALANNRAYRGSTPARASRPVGPVLFCPSAMAKKKKKGAGSGVDSDDLLDMAALAIKRFRRVTKEIGKLSTGQKLVGGLALLAAGLTYLARQDDNAPPTDKNALATLTDADEKPVAPANAKSPGHRRKKAHASEG